MGATTVERKALAPKGAPTESKRRRRTTSGEASLRRSQPHQVRRVCLNHRRYAGAVPPLQRAFHHAWRARASNALRLAILRTKTCPAQTARYDPGV